jgi:hypothetical protein
MKQGRAPTVQSGHKIEPRSHSINPTFVAQMGQAKGNHVMEKGDIPFKTEPMEKGQTLKAPMASATCHHSGSQGKHK